MTDGLTVYLFTLSPPHNTEQFDTPWDMQAATYPLVRIV